MIKSTFENRNEEVGLSLNVTKCLNFRCLRNNKNAKQLIQHKVEIENCKLLQETWLENWNTINNFQKTFNGRLPVLKVVLYLIIWYNPFLKVFFLSHSLKNLTISIDTSAAKIICLSYSDPRLTRYLHKYLNRTQFSNHKMMD